MPCLVLGTHQIIFAATGTRPTEQVGAYIRGLQWGKDRTAGPGGTQGAWAAPDGFLKASATCKHFAGAGTQAL